LLDDRRQRLTSSRTKAAKLGGTVADRGGAFLLQLFAHCWIAEGRDGRRIDLAGDVGRQLGRPKTPNQAVDSNPCTTSPIAGRSGNEDCRCALVTP